MSSRDRVCTPCDAGNHLMCDKRAWDWGKDDVTECLCWRAQHSSVRLEEIA